MAAIILFSSYWPRSVFAFRFYNFDFRKMFCDFTVQNVIICQFQVTFYCNIPNFVAKFGNSLRSSKVHFRIRKPAPKHLIGFTNFRRQSELLFTNRLANSEMNLLLNFATNFPTLQRISELRSEVNEINNKACNET